MGQKGQTEQKIDLDNQNEYSRWISRYLVLTNINSILAFFGRKTAEIDKKLRMTSNQYFTI